MPMDTVEKFDRIHTQLGGNVQLAQVFIQDRLTPERLFSNVNIYMQRMVGSNIKGG